MQEFAWERTGGGNSPLLDKDCNALRCSITKYLRGIGSRRVGREREERDFRCGTLRTGGCAYSALTNWC